MNNTIGLTELQAMSDGDLRKHQVDTIMFDVHSNTVQIEYALASMTDEELVETRAKGAEKLRVLDAEVYKLAESVLQRPSDLIEVWDRLASAHHSMVTLETGIMTLSEELESRQAIGRRRVAARDF
jgi:hypothetical protein